MIDESLVKRIKQRFSRASARYDEYAVLSKIISERLAARLDFISFSPLSILDLGCGTGILTKHILDRYPGASLVAADNSAQMLDILANKIKSHKGLHCIAADAHKLPFANHSFDLVVSNLLLPWVVDTDLFFRQVNRVIAESGLFLFSTYGPDTLQELRNCWQSVDADKHVNSFTDMHHIADALTKAGFTEPVVDAQILKLEYPSVSQLYTDLRGIGESMVMQAGLSGGLGGRKLIAACTQEYESLRNASGLLPVTFEVIYGLAWMPARKQRQFMDESGQINIPIDKIEVA